MSVSVRLSSSLPFCHLLYYAIKRRTGQGAAFYGQCFRRAYFCGVSLSPRTALKAACISHTARLASAMNRASSGARNPEIIDAVIVPMMVSLGCSYSIVP